jgi:hypothetical protein
MLLYAILSPLMQDPISLLIKIGKFGIPRVTFCNILGLVIDEDLKWDIYLKSLNSKLNSAMAALYGLRFKISFNMIMQVFHAYIMSNINYCMVAWAANKALLTEMFRSQKRAVRIINNFKNNKSLRGIFKSMGILTIPSLLILNAVMYKFNHGLDLGDFMKEHNYNTRNKNRLDLPCHKTTQFEKSPFYLIAKIYNLPVKFVNISEKNKLKLSLKTYLINKEYYSLEEYFNDK